MRHLTRNLSFTILTVLLTLCGLAIYWTREAGVERRTAKPVEATIVDQRLLATAKAMTEMAGTREEQALAQEALRLTDREVDLAFASALRDAPATAPPASGPAKELADRIAAIKVRIDQRQELVAKLTKAAQTSDDASDKLDLAKAQLTLDQDELEDAKADFERLAGDSHAKIERALQEHEAQHKNAAVSAVPPRRPTTWMLEQAQEWLALRGVEAQVRSAYAQAAARITALNREHDALEKLSQGQRIAADAPAADADAGDEDTEETSVMIERLRRMSDQRKSLADLDNRIQDVQHLAEVYKRWLPLVETRQGHVAHLFLISLAIVLGIVFTAAIVSLLIRISLARHADRRRMHQLRTIFTTALQVVATLLVLLVIFGPPSQPSTMVGLATAGLTVVLKDFIIAFFGWFVLMGKNGIRPGDWVEIEGIGGEVIEIGLLKTVLLEMGHWTSTGHPTGRRVDFVNKFAIEKHYFNFSTGGQWLWDDIVVTLPLAGNPYELAARLRDEVDRLTAADAALAEQDWARVTAQYETRGFSARPALDLRPSVNGIEVTVRYIVRAPQRYEVKSRLFESIVGMMKAPIEESTPDQKI